MLVKVDTNLVKDNIRRIKGASRGLVGGVVKAQCYGHGVKLAKYIENNLDWFCVANLKEAHELRAAGIRLPIQILGSVDELQGLDGIVSTIANTECFKKIVQAAREQKIIVDIELNTGMNRTGVAESELKYMLPMISGHPNIAVRGIFTHLADGADLKHCEYQLDRFEKATAGLPNSIIRHIAATNYDLLPDKFYKDAVRVGLSMYGYGASGVVPALTAGGRVVQINHVKANERVGYGCTVMPRDTALATVDFGYGDGVPRALSYKSGKLAIGGRLLDIVGTVCMDMIMVEVSDRDIKVGDRAYYISRHNTASEVARAAGTVVYEILTKVNLRANYEYI